MSTPREQARRPAWAEIDLGAIAGNVRRIHAGLAPGSSVMAVVKADAYGHGDVAVARAALGAGATWLGVILVDEGLRLRAAGIDAPVLLLHEPPADRVEEALANDLTPSLFTERGLEAIASAAERRGRPVEVHLKIDSGLNRLGVPLWMLDDFAAALAKQPAVEVTGAFTHFAFADQPEHAFYDEQVARFTDGLERLRSHGIEPALRHMANSAAAIARPDTHLDMVRLGIAMYGLSPGPLVTGRVRLEPAMSVKAEVAMVKRVPAGEAVSYGHRWRAGKPTTIASIPVGYADGWPRALGGNASVLIGGARREAVGTVCMDSFMASLGDDDCVVGDEAVLIGAQGEARVTADEHAERIGTINYEIVTRLGARVPRVPLG